MNHPHLDLSDYTEITSPACALREEIEQAEERLALLDPASAEYDLLDASIEEQRENLRRMVAQ